MFQRILVPLDGSTRSEQAIPVAALLARASGATLVLLRVANVPKEYSLYLFESYIAQTPILIDEVLREEMDKARNYLDILHQMQDLTGIQVENLVLNGAEAQTILDAARDQHADLMVMSGHGNNGFKQGTLGSVAMKVVRHSACPVLVLRQEHARLVTAQTSSVVSTTPVLVGVDGSTFSEAVLSPAVELAQALAIGEPGQLHLALVLRLPSTEGMSREEQEMHMRGKSEAEQYLDETARKLAQEGGTDGEPKPHLRVTWSVVTAPDVAEALIHAVQEGAERGNGTRTEYGVLALATHGRGGLQRWAVGSTTDRVIKGSSMPLLVVRPPYANG